jgi:CO dehydrogenase/acetyl-CoA synthase alpha subunit
MAFYRRGKVKGPANSRGPSVAPQKNYEPARRAQKPSGYAEIETASQSSDDSPEFTAFVRDVLNMPSEMSPAVREAISQQKWKISPNPLASIRTAAWQAARRMGLPVPNLPSPI